MSIENYKPTEELSSLHQTLFPKSNIPKNLVDHHFLLEISENVDLLTIENYHLQLLKDWRLIFDEQPDEQKNSKFIGRRIKLAALTALGTLYFACEGFDGITALLGVVSLPTCLLLGFGIIFSILAVIIFYSFDLAEISKNLGVSWQKAPALVDVYVDQLDEMKKIINAVTKLIANEDRSDRPHLSSSDKAMLVNLLAQMENHYDIIISQAERLQNKLDHPLIDIMQAIVTALAGIIHFSAGFFAGQTVALYVCTSLALSTSPAFLPILAFSIFIGIAAVSIYWYVEKPGIEKFVSRWIGIDKVKLERLQKPGRITDKRAQISVLTRSLSLFSQAAEETSISDRTIETSPECCHIQRQVHI